MPIIQNDITARHKAEAAAKGIEWLSSEELAAKEQAEQDQIAEENRIKELKARCTKKGLQFEAEEARYQASLKKRQAKKAAKHRKEK